MCFGRRQMLQAFLASVVFLELSAFKANAFSSPSYQCRKNRCLKPLSNRALALRSLDIRTSLRLNVGKSSSNDEMSEDEPQDPDNQSQQDCVVWLERATQSLLDTKRFPPGSLNKGKWHELTSIISAWSKAMREPELRPKAPLVIESLLKRIMDEHRAGNTEVQPTTELYNIAIDAWAISSIRVRQTKQRAASAANRAREILITMQKTSQAENRTQCLPNEHSFLTVLQALSKQKGGVNNARDMLQWMEDLYKMDHNPKAKPTLAVCVAVLDAIACSGCEEAGQQAEDLLFHMKEHLGIETNTICYNLAIKAWSKALRGRASAEHAERLLKETPEPDVFTYTSVIHAWAKSGMRLQAAERAEEILNQMEASPNVVTYNCVLNAWCRSGSAEAVLRAEALVKKMEHEHQCGRMEEGPGLISYNTYLHILSNHASIPGVAQQADEILTRMESKCDSGEVDISPNLFSYNLVIEAWSKSRNKNSAPGACGVLRRLSRRSGVYPDAFSYNQVIGALSRSKLPGAAQKAEELLLYMEAAYETGSSNAKPDVIGYASAIIAWSRSREVGSAERAERLLNRMEQKFETTGDPGFKPNAVVFNSVIDAWARSGEGILGARKAESLLQRMIMRCEEGDDKMKPSIVTYNAVLNAWARSGTRCCARKAERMLDLMWRLYNDGESNVKPDGMTYNTVINAISKSKNEGKAQKALRILRRMDKLYQAGDKDTRPNEFTYTSVLNSCAHCPVLDPKSRLKALDTAIFTLEELQESQYGDPNHVTYGTFLKACATLIPTEEKQMRRVVIERVFSQCCQDGQVGHMVLSRLRDAAPADLYEELLGVTSGDAIKLCDLPMEWRCNVKETKRWSDSWIPSSPRRRPHGRTLHRKQRQASKLRP